LKLQNRPEHYIRNQLVLDLPNPEVQDFIFDVLDSLMKKNVSYFKWDCNRHITNAYSNYLQNQQSHLYIEYVRGLTTVLE
jgi:alpha-galactosidase